MRENDKNAARTTSSSINHIINSQKKSIGELTFTTDFLKALPASVPLPPILSQAENYLLRTFQFWQANLVQNTNPVTTPLETPQTHKQNSQPDMQNTY